MVCPLKPGQIAVWCMKVGASSDPAIARWRRSLDPAERQHADRFRFDQDRRSYIAGHWLVRTALSSVSGIAPAAWRFAGTPGKPRLDPKCGRPELRFNLSRTPGLVACAISVGSEVGIDVEAVRPNGAELAVAARYFNPSELAILRGAAQDQRAHLFFRLWTLKEAFVKAIGMGLSRPLASFSFSLDPVSISFPGVQDDETTQWQFFERQPTPGYLLALAVKRQDDQPTTLTLGQLRSLP